MIQLKIDKTCCVACGNCEAWLPRLTEHIPRGRLLISENNPNVDAEAIQRAIDCCPLDALSLEVAP